MREQASLLKLIGKLFNIVFFFSPKIASRLAYNAFQRPRRRPMKSGSEAILRKGKYTFQTGKENIQYYKWGVDKASIVFLHGWESSSLRWKPYFDIFKARGITIAMLDAPGHGLSTSKLFNAHAYAQAALPLIKKEQPEIIVGHSIGGFTTMLLCNENLGYTPKRVILLAPNNKMKDILRTYQDILGFNDGLFNQMIADIVKFDGKTIDYYSGEALLKNISAPVTIIHDTDDKILPFNGSALMAEHNPDIELIKITGYGHKLKSKTIVELVLKACRKTIPLLHPSQS